MLRICVSALTLASGVFASGLAQANQNYYVIPGVGPQAPMQGAQFQPRANLGHPSLNSAESARQPASAQPRYAAATPGGYGGGFIELLMTGRDPTPRTAVMNRPPPADGSYQRFRGNYGAPPPMQTAPSIAPPRQASIAPEAGISARRVNARFERQ